MIALGVTFLAGCKSDPFPEGFVFGAAVAGFQVEMGCPTIPAETCEDRKSDWYQFITSTTAIARASNHLRGDPPTLGPGFYELYEADLDRLKGLGLGGFRFSIEWSRVFPESTVGVTGHDALKARASAAGLDYYKRVLAALKARGIKPLVTLNHYTLPTWIHDGVGCNQDLDTCSPRGWLEPNIVDELAKYAGFVAKELGGDVDLWATQNEPLAVVIPGYLLQTPTRTNPPAAAIRSEAKTVLVHMILAHARMYDAVKANDTIDADGDGKTSRVGLVYNVAPVEPKDPSRSLDRLAALNIDYLYNEVFLNGVLKGELDDDLDGTGEVREDLVGRSDYLGVNYYTRVRVEGDTDSILPDFSPKLTLNPLTVEQGAVYAKGLYDAIMEVKAEYPGVPLIITENGNDAEAGDSAKFLVEHPQWLAKAIDEGAPVEGYFWWSLMDNYEWNHGMAMKFGLFAVDTADVMKARTARPVADALARIAAARAIPEDLAKAFPITP